MPLVSVENFEAIPNNHAVGSGEWCEIEMANSLAFEKWCDAEMARIEASHKELQAYLEQRDQERARDEESCDSY